MKFYLVLILLGFYATVLFADDAPLCLVHGGNVKPINNNDIEMESEVIDITLYETHYEVEVNYLFKNTGEAVDVIMGFPSQSGDSGIKEFKAFDNGNALEIYEQKTDWEFMPPDGMSCQGLKSMIDQFKCHKVSFEKGESKTITNTYRQLYDPCYRGDSRSLSFHYILRTGAFWKGDISSIKVNVNTDELSYWWDLDHGGFFNGKQTSLRNFKTELTNVEPDFDLTFGLKAKNSFAPMHVSSTLPSSSTIDYGKDNLIDNDPTTAWVENTDGPGIGELIHFYNPSVSIQKVRSVSIINGYAKNESAFRNNNRVSCIKITTSVDISERDSEYFGDYYQIVKDYYDGEITTKTETIYILKDTKEKQVITFERPIDVSEIKVEILGVYKGDKYNDTAISEIKFDIVKEYKY